MLKVKLTTSGSSVGKVNGLDRRQAKKAAKRLDEAAALGPTESAAGSRILEPTPPPPPVIDDARLAGGDDDFENSESRAREESSQTPFDEEIRVEGPNQSSLKSRGSPEGGAHKRSNLCPLHLHLPSDSSFYTSTILPGIGEAANSLDVG